jgi:hypothetical protein
MNVRQVMFSIPGGARATLAIPVPVTMATIELLEAASGQAFQSLRRDAHGTTAHDAGAIEHDSWLAPQAGGGALDASRTRDAGAVEYASWFAGA